ncbi:hypothetical protein KGM_201002 [Danaus plexippus plexippus]|uniref:Uncharacterized protein n=1 Tax=Danaus plexippus plexippus TaxID=278856 RepID=A0A212EQC6_DANPL|nr:hypothetical protein KGM_201002 [Danaus plexippus plexippus]
MKSKPGLALITKRRRRAGAWGATGRCRPLETSTTRKYNQPSRNAAYIPPPPRTHHIPTTDHH